MIERNRAGWYRKNLSGDAEYKSFVPTVLPPDPKLVVDEELLLLLSEAHRVLGILEGVSSQIPDVDLFMAMYVRKEALMSSQIEGTQATLEDVLSPEIDKNANRDVRDVVNYVSAMEIAIELLQKLPLCCRLMRNIHAVLMKDTRGNEKYSGEFRRTQNWICGAGSTLQTARYIPPNVEDMQDSMSELEKYINEYEGTDELIKVALIHYQFETIHPFLDGNGRVGRLLIVLYLIEKGILTLPVLYISYYLKANRIEYYDRMSEVRRSGNYEQWVKFFLHAIIVSSENAIETIKALSVLKAKDMGRVQTMGRASKTVSMVLEYFERTSLATTRRVSEDLNLSYSTVSSAIKRLCDVEILHCGGKVFRGRAYYYKDYLDILRNGTE